jgi:hypothetical protein
MLRFPSISTSERIFRERTDLDENGFAPADAFTGRTKVERGPRGRLDVVEERISRYLLVATRARRVGTNGHSTAAGCWENLVLYAQLVNVCEYKQASR